MAKVGEKYTSLYLIVGSTPAVRGMTFDETIAKKMLADAARLPGSMIVRMVVDATVVAVKSEMTGDDEDEDDC